MLEDQPAAASPQALPYERAAQAGQGTAAPTAPTPAPDTLAKRVARPSGPTANAASNPKPRSRREGRGKGMGATQPRLPTAAYSDSGASRLERNPDARLPSPDPLSSNPCRAMFPPLPLHRRTGNPFPCRANLPARKSAPHGRNRNTPTAEITSAPSPHSNADRPASIAKKSPSASSIPCSTNLPSSKPVVNLDCLQPERSIGGYLQNLTLSRLTVELERYSPNVTETKSSRLLMM